MKTDSGKGHNRSSLLVMLFLLGASVDQVVSSLANSTLQEILSQNGCEIQQINCRHTRP